MGLGGQRHAQAALLPRKGNDTRFTQEAVWAPGTV